MTNWCLKAWKAVCHSKAAFVGVIHQLMGGVRSSMGYLGVKTSLRCTTERKFGRDYFGWHS